MWQLSVRNYNVCFPDVSSLISAHISSASLPAKIYCWYGILDCFYVIRSFLGLPNLTTCVKPWALSPDDLHSILYINGLSKWQLSTKLSNNLVWLHCYVQLPIGTHVTLASLHVLHLTSLPAKIYCCYGILGWFYTVRSFLGLPSLTTYVKTWAPNPDDLHNILYISGLSKWQLIRTELCTILGWFTSVHVC